MSENLRVDVPPSKPLLVFDGDCSFCRAWIARWQKTTRDQIDYLPFQEPQVAERFPMLPRVGFEQAVHLIDTDGQVFRGAEAVFRSRAVGSGQHWSLWAHQTAPGFASAAEFVYRLIARHRSAAWFVTRVLWGSNVRHQPRLDWQMWFAALEDYRANSESRNKLK